MSNDIVDVLARGSVEAFNLGLQIERDRIIALAENKICFDHKAGKGCDHSGCYEIVDLISRINVLKK